MKPNHHHLVGKEFPHTDQINIILIIIFLIVWVLDSFIFNFSIILAIFIPWVIRIIIFIGLMSIAIVIGLLSHKTLFSEEQETITIIKEGIFAHVRHPLYLSIVLTYLAFSILTMSLICIILWILIFILYNKMVNYEEKDLEKTFGEEYSNYKKKVPKWIPRLVSPKIENSKNKND
jgi:protein-S-isoprenylcysteine O-methyltransferase Ste14